MSDEIEIVSDGEGIALFGEPRNQPPYPIPAQVEYLGRFGINLGREVFGVESVVQDRRVSPEKLIER
ncbi:MAG TPA: hypothetical protein H9769_03325 [Candidatus Microbacterium pullistercoris]|nr:hypothetical protein [Candidatus Microbacterium pullistercoris]